MRTRISTVYTRCGRSIICVHEQRSCSNSNTWTSSVVSAMQSHHSLYIISAVDINTNVPTARHNGWPPCRRNPLYAHSRRPDYCPLYIIL